MRNSVIEAYIVAWNEAETIHLTIRHYQKFCDQITILDNYSDDGTADIATDLGCKIKTFGIRGELDDGEYIKVKNSCWKGSQADFVVVVDADEIIFHPNIQAIFEKALRDRKTIFRTCGYNMYSEEMPENDFLEIRTGLADQNYSKLACFSPQINDINYVYGCHEANPVGNVRFSDDTLNLYHYRNIGGFDRLQKRHEIYRKRLSIQNQRLGLGVHYTFDEEKRRKSYAANLSRAMQSGECVIKLV